MKEIKFKAQRADGKGWVIGYYWFKHDKKTHWIIDSSDIKNQFGVQVIPKTVCQFTGLKDKNKVDVYSSDHVIVNYGKWQNEQNGKTRRGVVEYDVKDCAFVVKIEDSEVRVSFSIIASVEVIGNIHDKIEQQ